MLDIAVMPPPPPPPGVVDSNLLYNAHGLYSSNICETFLYNRQLPVITYELIFVVQAAHR